MRLLFINSLYPPHVGGGAEVILQEHVEEMARRGHAVAVLSTGPDHGLVSGETNGIPVHRAGIENLYWHFTQNRPGPLRRLAWHWRDRYNPAMRAYVTQVIRTERPQLVVCHNLTGWSISVWDEIAAAQLPIVQVIHDLYLVCPRTNMFKRDRACAVPCAMCHLLRQRHVEASRLPSAVVGVSHYVLDRLTSFGHFAGVSKSVVHNARRIADPGVRHAPLTDAPIRFGYIGTLSPAKGLEWLIQQFQADASPATLAIAGKGQQTYEAQLRALADPSRVSFLGYTNSTEFYSNIDVCIVPSIWPDTFPGVAYEACAHHVPVIASRTGGLPEIIRDGINGLLCDVNDRASLGRAMRTLQTERQMLSTLISNARSSVLEMLDTDRVHSQYEAIYQEVAAR